MARFLKWTLIILPFFLYGQSILFGFVLDDAAVLDHNSFVTSGLSGIPRILSTCYWQGYSNNYIGLYRPLSQLMFAMEWDISGGKAWLSHLLNILLYSACGVLIFDLIRKISISPINAALVAALFIAHPIHTEVVANIKSRDEILAFFFFILVILRAERSGLSSTKDQVWASLLLLGGLLAKESSIMILPLTWLYLTLFKDQTPSKTLKNCILLILTGLLWLGWWFTVVYYLSTPLGINYLDNTMVLCSGKFEHIGSGIYLIGLYLTKLILPLRLAYDYSFNQIPNHSFFSVEVLITLSLLLIGLYFVFTQRRSRPILFFGTAIVVFYLLLPSNLFITTGTTFGERLLFTPVFGFSLILFSLLDRIPAKKILTPLFGVLIILYSTQTLKRVPAWRSNETLFSEDIHRLSGSFKANNNYAAIHLLENNTLGLSRQACLDTAVAYYKRAINIDSSQILVFEDLAKSQFLRSDYNGAISTYHTIIKTFPKQHKCYVRLAECYLNLGQYDSCDHYMNSAKVSGYLNQQAYIEWAIAQFQSGQYQKAEQILLDGLGAFPGDKNLLDNLNALKEKMKQTSTAPLQVNILDKED